MRELNPVFRRWGSQALLLAIALSVTAAWLSETWLGRNINFIVAGLLALSFAYTALGTATGQTASDIDRIDRELDEARQRITSLQNRSADLEQERNRTR